MKPAFSFISALNKLYQRRNPLREFMERTGRIHPSQIHKACPRKVVLELLRVIPESTPTLDLTSQRIFDTGHMFHTLFQWYSAKMVEFGILVKCSIEQPVVSNELMINGRADSEITPVEYDECIIDYKSIKNIRYQKLRRPESKDITQVQIYMHVRKKKRALIFYHNKDTHAEKEFEVIYDESYVAPYIKSILTCIELFKKKKIPGRDKYPGAKVYRGKPVCNNRFCEYRFECLRPESDNMVVGKLVLWDGSSSLPGDGKKVLGDPPTFNHGVKVFSGVDVATMSPEENSLTTSQLPGTIKHTSGWHKILENVNGS